MKLPAYVKNVISASVRDIIYSIKSCNPNMLIKKFAKEDLEDSIYSLVHDLYWFNKEAEDSGSVVRDKISRWVSENASKDIYEKYIGAEKSLVNLLGNMYINTPMKLKSDFPDLYSLLSGEAQPKIDGDNDLNGEQDITPLDLNINNDAGNSSGKLEDKTDNSSESVPGTSSSGIENNKKNNSQNETSVSDDKGNKGAKEDVIKIEPKENIFDKEI